MSGRLNVRDSLRVPYAVFRVRRLRFTAATEAYFRAQREERAAEARARRLAESMVPA